MLFMNKEELYSDPIFQIDVINYEKIFFYDDIPSYHTLNLDIKKQDDSYIISFERVISSNLYFYRTESNQFYYSFSEEDLAEFLVNELGVQLTENSNFVNFMNQQKRSDNTVKVNHYEEIYVLSLYHSVVIRKTGFDPVYIDDLFTVPLEDAKSIIYDWINTYTDLCKEHKDTILPDLSAGFDTRALTYFWRELGIDKIYTKDDTDELYIVKQIVSEINDKYDQHISLTHTVSGNTDKIRVSGKAADIFAVKERFLDQNYLINNIGKFKHQLLANGIAPFLDKNILKLRPYSVNIFKPLIQYLLAKPLMHIPYKTFARRDFTFTQEKIDVVENIIKTWENKPDNNITFYNNNIQPINILHFNGNAVNHFKHTIQYILDNVKLNYSGDFDIVTTYTDQAKCILLQQCDLNNIPVYNSCKYFSDASWYMPNKIKYILNTLIKDCKNDIVMILDGYDTLMVSLDNIVDKFKEYNCKVLFNATSNHYPNIEIDGDIDYSDKKGVNGVFFNAGCCIGYREDLIKIYYDAYYEIMGHIKDNLWDSEQFILRISLGKKKYEGIDIDYKDSIFKVMCNSVIIQKNTNEYMIV